MQKSNQNQLITAFTCLMIFLLTANLHPLEIVVDNDQGAPTYIETGTWTTSPSTGYAGGTYRYCLATSGAPTHTATWTPDIPSQQRFEVYACYRQSDNRSTDVQVTIAHSEGTALVSLNQNGPQEVVETYLGEYLFEAGTSGNIKIHNGFTSDNIIADAFILRTPVDPLPVINNERRNPQLATSQTPITFTATITDNTVITSASLCYTIDSTMETHSFTVYDDGNHQDGAAGDNIYGITLPPFPKDSIVGYHFIASDDLNQLGKGTPQFFKVGDLPTGMEDIIVDNDDGPPRYIETGSWSVSSSVGYEGGTYVYTTGVDGEPTHSATWVPNIPRIGIYEIFAFFNGGPSRSNGIPMTITHSMGETVVYLDQTKSGYQQAYLGDFPFDEGTTGSVRMDNNGAPGIYIADTIIWHQPADPLPIIGQVTRTPSHPSSTESVLVTCDISDNSSIAEASVIYTVNQDDVTTLPMTMTKGNQAATFHAKIPAYPDNTQVSFYIFASDNLGQVTTSAPQKYTVNSPPTTVYAIIGSDTSIWGITGGYYGTCDWEVFESRTGVLATIYEPAFRYRITDSLGRPFKLTWYMHGGGWFTPAINSSPISPTYHIRKNWGPDIDKWGDAYELHYHHFIYDPNTGWEMAPTFGETIPDYEWTVSEMILEEDIFITSFRSGWNYMDNEYQQYLERWVPFRNEGVQSDYLPYHPSFTNYRVPGEMKGWEVRHEYMASVSPNRVETAFRLAAESKVDRMICFWSHQNESDFPEQIIRTDQLLRDAEEKYPGTQFIYCSAKEAMQKWLGHSTPAPPPMKLETTVTSNDVHVVVQTSDDIYQEQPWVAARRYDDECVRLDTTKDDIGTWSFNYSKSDFDAVAVAVSDIYGNEKILPVEDGSKRWTLQSEFIKASPQQVDFETSPTLVMLAKNNSDYLPEGKLTFEYQAPLSSSWESILIEGEAPAGTTITTQYRIAKTQQGLETQPWSLPTTDQDISLPANNRTPWIQIKVELTGTQLDTPKLDSVEVFYTPVQPKQPVASWVLE